MNRILKDATVQRYHGDSHAQLRAHLEAFVMAYNFAKRRKTLDGLAPCEYSGKIRIQTPQRFTLNPTHHFPELNT